MPRAIRRSKERSNLLIRFSDGKQNDAENSSTVGGIGALKPWCGKAKLYLEWKAAGRSAELHIYSQGGYGFGMIKRGLPVDGWVERFGEWLQIQGLLKTKE